MYLHGIPRPLSNIRRSLETFSLGGFSNVTWSRRPSPSLIRRENRQTKMPTPPFLRPRISPAFRSSHTLSPSLICSRSTRRLRSTKVPASPAFHTQSPEVRSTLQHSLGTMLAEIKVDEGGRRDSARLRRIHTRAQWSFLAATCVLVR